MRINAINTNISQNKSKLLKPNRQTLQYKNQSGQEQINSPSFKGIKNATKLSGLYAAMGGLASLIFLPEVAVVLAFTALAGCSGFVIGAKIDDSEDPFDLNRDKK